MFPDSSNFLIVDDSNAARTFIKRQLEALGYKNMVEAVNGNDALSKIESIYKSGKTVELILADWHMPVMSGIDLLMNLKGNPNYSIIPFLMLTNESETENVVKALILGVADFVVKPFTEAMMIEKLTAIWKKIGKGKEKDKKGT